MLIMLKLRKQHINSIFNLIESISQLTKDLHGLFRRLRANLVRHLETFFMAAHKPKPFVWFRTVQRRPVGLWQRFLA